MSIFNLFKRSSEKKEPKPEVSDHLLNENQEISYLDEFGKEQKISKAEWINQVLKPSIEKNWDDVEELYSIVLDSFSKNVYYEAKDACLRIYSLDNNKERKTNILGIYYIKNREYDQAIDLYKKYTFYEKPSEAIYSNYAKVLEKKDNLEEAEKLYLKALNLNPNSANAFKKYFDIIKKRNIAEYNAKLEEFAHLEDTWRAKLTLAVKCFKNGELEKGKKLLNTALRESEYDSEVMSIASGVYGMNNLFEEFENEILPHFNPENHGAYTAINILEYYKRAEDFEKGLELCKFTSKFPWFEFCDTFINYEKIFLNMKIKYDKQKLEDDFYIERTEERFFTTNVPIWYYGFNNPTWLLNKKKRVSPNLLILSFTSIGEYDIISRNLAVSIPLYLNEILHYKTNLNYQLAIAYEGYDLKIANKRYSTDYMKLIKSQNPNLSYVLSGNVVKSVDENNEKLYETEVYLYDCSNEMKIKLIDTAYKKEELYKIQKDIINKFNNFFECMDKDFEITETNSENLMLYSPKVKFLLGNSEYKEYQSWKYKKLLFEQIKVVLDDKENEFKKVNLVALLYEIGKTNSQLLKCQKPSIYNMISRDVFKSKVSRLLVPIIFNVYNDEVNYDTYMETLNEENPMYIDWVNRFLDYVD